MGQQNPQNSTIICHTFLNLVFFCLFCYDRLPMQTSKAGVAKLEPASKKSELARRARMLRTQPQIPQGNASPQHRRLCPSGADVLVFALRVPLQVAVFKCMLVAQARAPSLREASAGEIEL